MHAGRQARERAAHTDRRSRRDIWPSPHVEGLLVPLWVVMAASGGAWKRGKGAGGFTYIAGLGWKRESPLRTACEAHGRGAIGEDACHGHCGVMSMCCRRFVIRYSLFVIRY